MNGLTDTFQKFAPKKKRSGGYSDKEERLNERSNKRKQKSKSRTIAQDK